MMPTSDRLRERRQVTSAKGTYAPQAEINPAYLRTVLAHRSRWKTSPMKSINTRVFGGQQGPIRIVNRNRTGIRVHAGINGRVPRSPGRQRVRFRDHGDAEPRTRSRSHCGGSLTTILSFSDADCYSPRRFASAIAGFDLSAMNA